MINYILSLIPMKIKSFLSFFDLKFSEIHISRLSIMNQYIFDITK